MAAQALLDGGEAATPEEAAGLVARTLPGQSLEAVTRRLARKLRTKLVKSVA
jgi:hypothetical protein